MNSFENLINAMTTSALDVLADFNKQAATDAGIAPAQVSSWEKLHKIYYGKTTSPQKQRLAREKAQRKGFSLDQLAMIERRIKDIASARTRTKLRLALLEAQGNYRALERVAKRLVPSTEKPSRKQVTFSRSKGGRRTMTVTADERDIADLEHALSRETDPTKPMAPQMHDRFIRLIRGKGGGVPTAVPRPLILVPLPEWSRIVRGDGDETILQLTDGTTITGAQFLAQYVGAELEIATFHPQEGPVNLYRGQRLANQKQRDLARATTPQCPVPDCRHSADRCEIHHIQAWQHGGETNLDNLAPLCRYHNRVNDDDPTRSRRGRIVNLGGSPVWRSPRGHIVRRNSYGAMHTLFA